jgi:amidase
MNRRVFLRQTVSTGAALASRSIINPVANSAEWLSVQKKVRISQFAELDATALGELVRKKQVTPLELVEDTLRRIERINPQLNLVLTKLYDVEKARARAAQPLSDSPFAGVPLLLKNIVEFKDADIDFGSRYLARLVQKNGRLHKANSPFIQAVEKAGMIVVGITNAPEFGMIDTTEPMLYGASCNPWNPAYTTGGSSGGSAAAVAAGIVPLAHANDGGGSIRIPSCQCGIFGLKPTRKRELTPFTIGSMANDVAGIASDLCVSRSVRDLAAFLNIVENKANDKLPPTGFISGPSSRRLKIALVLNGVNGEKPDAEVEKAIRASAKLCETLKHTVEEVTLPINGEQLTDAFLGYWAAGTLSLESEIASALGKDVRLDEVLEPWTIGLMQMSKKRGLFQTLSQATRAFASAANTLEGFFKAYDVILSPVMRLSPYKLGWHNPQVAFDTLMKRVLNDVCYTPLHNACGTPAMSVPLYWTKGDLPIGSQFAAWRGGEAMLLHLAYELEAARPWAKRKPAMFANL